MPTLALSKAVEHWPPTSLREKQVKIGAKVVAHGCLVSRKSVPSGQNPVRGLAIRPVQTKTETSLTPTWGMLDK
jgi:hypothetical protein